MSSTTDNENNYTSALSDERMKTLFSMFDQDSDGTIDFTELATYLYKIREDMSEATNEAIQFFLMLDKDDKRRLDFKMFVRLILHIFAGEGMNFFEAVDYLIEELKNVEITSADRKEITIAANNYRSHRDMAKNEKEVAEVADALNYAKLQKLFEMYDTSGEGMISLEELLLTCRKFHRTRGIPLDSTVNETVTTMLNYDKDKNQNMDLNEFALCVVRFSKICHKELDEMIDFLANAIRLGVNTPEEISYMKAMIAVENDNLKSTQELQVRAFKEKKEKLDDLKKPKTDESKEEKKEANDYVKNARAILAYEIESKEIQLGMLEALAEASEEVKFEVLFGMLDKDTNDRVNVRELSDALRKMGLNDKFKDAVEKAQTYIAMYDSDFDASLDREEFRNYIMRMTAEMGSTTFKEMAEYIIMTLVFSSGGHNEFEDAILEAIEGETAGIVKKKSIYISALTHPKFFNLFQMFDKNSDRTIDFKEVAMGLFKLRGDMDKSTQDAMDILLLLDKEDKRCLSYEQFVTLILKVFAAEGEKIFDIIDDVIDKMNDGRKVGVKAATILIISEAIYNGHVEMMAAEREDSEVMDALQYAKLLKLFDIYDTSNDGYISLEELLIGCRTFHKTLGIDKDVTIDETTLTMLEYDKDKNQKMDKDEFALCVVRYARMNNMDLHDMIDFLANKALLEDHSPAEREYMKSKIDIESKKLKSMQGVGDKKKANKKEANYVVHTYVNEDDTEQELWA